MTGDKQIEPIATLARHRRWDGKTWFARSTSIAGCPGCAGARRRRGRGARAPCRGEGGRMIRLTLESPDQPEVQPAHRRPRRVPAAALPRGEPPRGGARRPCSTPPAVAFVVARIDGAAVGCSAVVVHGPDAGSSASTCDPSQRGLPASAGALMERLESRGPVQRGASVARLETGIHPARLLRSRSASGAGTRTAVR